MEAHGGELFNVFWSSDLTPSMRYTSDSTISILRNLDLSCSGLCMAACVKGSFRTKSWDASESSCSSRGTQPAGVHELHLNTWTSIGRSLCPLPRRCHPKGAVLVIGALL